MFQASLLEFANKLVADEIRADRLRYGRDHIAMAAALCRRLAVATDWAHNDTNPLSDGDQCILDGTIPNAPGNIVLHVWCDGWEINMLLDDSVPLQVKYDLAPPFIHACVLGDLSAVQAAIRDNRDSFTLVNSHYGGLRMTPLMFCAAGARSVGKEFFPVAAASTADHVAVAAALVTAGARLEARDVAGFTALAQATTVFASRASVAVADFLLRQGANVQPVDRCGRTPLVQFGSGAPPDRTLWSVDGVPAAALLLLEAGADAGFSAEKNSPREQLCAALEKIAPKYLSAQGIPVNESNLRNLMAHSYRPPAILPSVMQRVALAARVSPENAALLRAINDCQVRGRVGAGRTLEGQAVRIFGLKQADLNGTIVSVCGVFDPVSGRYEVCVPRDDGIARRLVRIQAKNIEAANRKDSVFFTREPACITCTACSVQLSEAKTCSRCHRARYCSEACQRIHWKSGHKAECTAAHKESNAITLQQPRAGAIGEDQVLYNSNGSFRVRFWDAPALARMLDHVRIIKISAVLGEAAAATALTAYDEAREFAARISVSDPAHALLLAQIKSAGCGGLKAYFSATFRRTASPGDVPLDSSTVGSSPHFPFAVTINLKPLEHQHWL